MLKVKQIKNCNTECTNNQYRIKKIEEVKMYKERIKNHSQGIIKKFLTTGFLNLLINS